MDLLTTFGVQRKIGSRGRFEVVYSGSRYNMEPDVQGSGSFPDGCNPLLGHATTYCNAGVTNPFKDLLAPFIGTSETTLTTVSRNTPPDPISPIYGTYRVRYQKRRRRTWYNSLRRCTPFG